MKTDKADIAEAARVRLGVSTLQPWQIETILRFSKRGWRVLNSKTAKEVVKYYGDKIPK